jgi:hypothetical protein
VLNHITPAIKEWKINQDINILLIEEKLSGEMEICPHL